ncbi:MAG: NAD(+) synthase [Alphaproteobacteria bacterium]|nr:NAD(+) synthase [Alphaproteobacteria bacterium]
MNPETKWHSLTKDFHDFIATRGFSDVLIGLSGGIDSAVVTALAADALGKDKVHCLMMPSKNTSDLSKELASEMAKNLGIDFRTVPIQELADTYNQTFAAFFTSVQPIVTENIQARIRGNILMAFSNQYNWLTLCCSNRSEIAMGYCTLYGDTVGGLCPIGNLYKTEVYELANWRNTVSPIIPEGIISRAPSAELAIGQKDEDTLPPYPLLDSVLAELLDKQKTTAEISRNYPAETVDWIAKRWQSMSFKRNLLPPAL